MPRARKSEAESMYTIYSHMNYLRAIHAHMQQHTDTIARDHRIDTLACVYECVLQCFVCCVHTLSRIVSHIHILFTRVMLPYAIITYSNCKACAVRRHNLTERVICLTHSAYTRASNAQHTHTHTSNSRPHIAVCWIKWSFCIANATMHAWFPITNAPKHHQSLSTYIIHA